MPRLKDPAALLALLLYTVDADELGNYPSETFTIVFHEGRVTLGNPFWGGVTHYYPGVKLLKLSRLNLLKVYGAAAYVGLFEELVQLLEAESQVRKLKALVA